MNIEKVIFEYKTSLIFVLFVTCDILITGSGVAMNLP